MTANDADEKQPLVPADPEKAIQGKLEGPGASFHLLVQQYKIPLIILYYGLCSSTLIVINKVAVHNIRVSLGPAAWHADRTTRRIQTGGGSRFVA